MRHPHDLTVVIPSRDRIRLLENALDALGRQEEVDLGRIQVVVVLDGDSTGSAATLQSRNDAFSLTVLEQRKSGAGASRNRGWREAESPHVVFLDDDMLATPRFLVEHLLAHREAPNAVVIGRFSAQPGVRVTAWSRYDELVQEKRYRSYQLGEELSGVRCYTGNMAVPKELLEQVGGFDTHLTRNEDIDLGFRLQEIGTSIVFASGAEARHCGYRELPEWLQIPSLYGRVEVALYRERGYAGGLESIVGCWHDRNLLNRVAVRLALVDGAPSQALITLAIKVAVAAHSARFDRLSYAAMSFVYNALYWEGVSEGLRGSSNLWAIVRRTKRAAARPYSKNAAA